MKTLVSLALMCGTLAGCAEIQRFAPLELYEPKAKAAAPVPIVVDVGDASLVCFVNAKLLRFIVIEGNRVINGGCDEPIITRKGRPS